MSPADEDVARRCRAGDVDAFEILYGRQAARIYTLACRMAGSPDDGEDLLQEIFLQAYRKIGTYKGDATIGTWLYRLALNHCLDYVRSRAAKMKTLTGGRIGIASQALGIAGIQGAGKAAGVSAGITVSSCRLR